MKCEGCGVEALALKTVRWRRGKRRFVLCDCCHGDLAACVWVVAGRETVAARCERCESFFNPDGMAKPRPAGRWDSFGGVCRDCS